MKFIKRVAAVLFLCVLCTGGYLGYQGYQRYSEVQKETSLEEKVTEIKEKPSYTSLADLSATYCEAVVAVEDKRYYKHPGIDIISIGRAIKNNIQAGELIEGGSTITQQLAKNFYFNQERSVIRKIAEAFMAFKLEQQYTKDEILELYVNSIYFGDGYYCVGDASRGYFGKTPSDMSDYESTMLAGIPNAPSAYAPTVSMELAESRQKKVIACMVKQKYLSEEEAGKIKLEKELY